MKKSIKSIKVSNTEKSITLSQGNLLPPKVPSVNGGNCEPLPNPEKDYLGTANNLLDLCPDDKRHPWRKNYNTK